ncbi:phenylacetate--CoA ligase family protein, partial [Streptomyces sp. SID10815]|nr:phenylacetate--CoA ligase family protein [Streptomyces sp. SID10815]
RARLEDRIAAAGLPLTGLVLHDDRAALPPTAPLRADLREHSFETPPAPPAAPPAPAPDTRRPVVAATVRPAADQEGSGP